MGRVETSVANRKMFRTMPALAGTGIVARAIETRNDLAERVSSRIRAEVEAFQPRRKVWAAPGCIQPDKLEFDRQLTMELSVKRQKIKLDGRDLNLVIAGGVSTNGLLQEHELQPVVIVQEERVSDDQVVDALVEFVDRVVVAALRRS